MMLPLREGVGAAAHLQPGLRLPDLALASTQGGAVSLGQISGRSVIFIYPWSGRPDLPNPPRWDDIPGAHGSTPQAQGFRDLHAAFADAGTQVFGLSSQQLSYQHEFAQRLQLPFALLSDEAFQLQHALSLPTFETGGVTYLTRLTLVVDNGVLRRCFYPIADPAGHAAHLLVQL